MISHENLLVQWALEGWSNCCPAEQIAPLGTEAVVEVASLPPNISYLQPPTLSADAAGWGGLAWPAPCTADLRKAGGRGIISGQVSPEIHAADLGTPLLRSMSAPGSSVLSVFCSWRLNVQVFFCGRRGTGLAGLPGGFLGARHSYVSHLHRYWERLHPSFS